MEKKFNTLKISANEEITRLILNRPEQHNAMNREMILGITRFFKELRNQKETRIVIMEGAGKSFCAGADLMWMKDSAGLTPKQNRQETKMLGKMFKSIFRSPAIVIGAAHGNIFGGGNGLLAACDLAYCTADSQFSLSETRIGLVAATISPYLLLRIQPARAKELIYTAERFNGRQAESFGLVNRAFSNFEEMQAHIEKTAQAILAGGPVSVMKSKKQLNKLSMGKFPDNTEKKAARILAASRISDEAQEGLQAFVEKRKPKWSR